jgi:hypothetical protein
MRSRPESVYTECLLRTMTNNGMVMLTFTPLRGISTSCWRSCRSSRPSGRRRAQGRGLRHLGRRAAPHPAGEGRLWGAIPPFQRDARSKGLPQLGAGLIYPVPEGAFVCEPFEIPKHWPRSYGSTSGGTRRPPSSAPSTARRTLAYIYSEHYQGEVEPAVHVSAIQARGKLPGAIDPAAKGRSQVDGRRLMQEYRPRARAREAANAVEAGIFATWERFSTGRLKVFRTCQNLSRSCACTGEMSAARW